MSGGKQYWEGPHNFDHTEDESFVKGKIDLASKWYWYQLTHHIGPWIEWDLESDGWNIQLKNTSLQIWLIFSFFLISLWASPTLYFGFTVFPHITFALTLWYLKHPYHCFFSFFWFIHCSLNIVLFSIYYQPFCMATKTLTTSHSFCFPITPAHHHPHSSHSFVTLQSPISHLAV